MNKCHVSVYYDFIRCIEVFKLFKKFMIKFIVIFQKVNISQTKKTKVDIAYRMKIVFSHSLEIRDMTH